MADFPTVQDGEVVTPNMDDYGMKCCDCDLIHRFRFRAIRVTEHLPDGTFRYQELDPSEYRVQMTASRPAQQPPWPKRNGRPGQPMCETCPGPDHKPSWRNLWTPGCCGLAYPDMDEAAATSCRLCDGSGRYGDGAKDGSDRWIECPNCSSGVAACDGSLCQSDSVKAGPPWCCEKGEALNVTVCPDCADTTPDAGARHEVQGETR